MTRDNSLRLSSYRDEALRDFTGHYGWHTLEFGMPLPMTHGCKTKRKKIEVLTANYPVSVEQRGEGEKISSVRTRHRQRMGGYRMGIPKYTSNALAAPSRTSSGVLGLGLGSSDGMVNING